MLKKEFLLKVGLAEMLKGGVIMDVTNADQAKIAEDSGAVAVMALEKIPADIRTDGGIARMSNPKTIKKIQETITGFSLYLASISTPSPTEVIIGARMNTACKFRFLPFKMTEISVTKESLCRPYALRSTVISIRLRVGYGKFSTLLARLINPAQVPIIGCFLA